MKDLAPPFDQHQQPVSSAPDTEARVLFRASLILALLGILGSLGASLLTTLA